MLWNSSDPKGKFSFCAFIMNTVSVQIAAKNLLVCPGLSVESEERCVCVWQLNVDGCIWMGGGKAGGREHKR